MQEDSTHTHALAIARDALADHPRAHLPYPGYASTLGDIAAHLVATAAARRTNWSPAKAVAKHLDAGREAIDQLSLVTADPAPDARRQPFSSTLEGMVGRKWQLNSGFLHHYGVSWQLSGSMRGLFRTLPHQHPDLEEMTRRYRIELAKAGLPNDVVARGHARIGANPHGSQDGRPWTAFVVPMRDSRLDHVASIVDLGHQSTLVVDNSLHDYARQALAVHENHDRLVQMINAAEDIALDATIDTPNLEFVETSLYAVSINRGPRLKDAVVIHVRLTGLSEALRPVPLLAVMTGEIGLARPTTTTLPSLVKSQMERSRALARLGSATIDRTGRLFMEAAEHVPSDLLDALDSNVVNVETRLHAGYGTKAWFKISNGRITAAVDISAEVRWKHDRLEVRRQLPETLISTLPGRPASVIMEHPALDGVTIRSARMHNGRLVIGIAPIWEPL